MSKNHAFPTLPEFATNLAKKERAKSKPKEAERDYEISLIVQEKFEKDRQKNILEQQERYKALIEKNEKTKALIKKRDEANRDKLA